jgi:hypothetical protein
VARRITLLIAEGLIATGLLGLVVIFGGVGILTADALLHGQHVVMAALWTPMNFLLAACCLALAWRLVHG